MSKVWIRCAALEGSNSLVLIRVATVSFSPGEHCFLYLYQK